jgi:uncharacterized protein YqgC (DUF456 family)
MHWAIYVVLLLISLGGIFLTLLALPGLWVMIAAAIGYAWYTGGQYIGWWTIGIMIALAATAELIEFFGGSTGAKKAGGSRRAAWGALIGGILGAIILTIPVPIIGTTIGLCIGVFVGALIGEMGVRRDADHLVRVGFAAAKMQLLAILIKLLFGVTMLGIVAFMALPLPSRRTTPPAPTTAPTSSPAST